MKGGAENASFHDFVYYGMSGVTILYVEIYVLYIELCMD